MRRALRSSQPKPFWDFMVLNQLGAGAAPTPESPWQEQPSEDSIPVNLCREIGHDPLQNSNPCLPQEPEVLCHHPADV